VTRIIKDIVKDEKRNEKKAYGEREVRGRRPEEQLRHVSI
jgi:hypothetical protein